MQDWTHAVTVAVLIRCFWANIGVWVKGGDLGRLGDGLKDSTAAFQIFGGRSTRAAGGVLGNFGSYPDVLIDCGREPLFSGLFFAPESVSALMGFGYIER